MGRERRLAVVLKSRPSPTRYVRSPRSAIACGCRRASRPARTAPTPCHGSMWFGDRSHIRPLASPRGHDPSERFEHAHERPLPLRACRPGAVPARAIEGGLAREVERGRVEPLLRDL